MFRICNIYVKHLTTTDVDLRYLVTKHYSFQPYLNQAVKCKMHGIATVVSNIEGFRINELILRVGRG